MHPVFTGDQPTETVNRMYALFRYVDRLFEPKRHRDEEIAAIDLSLMTDRAQYLLRHTLILKRCYEDALNKHPNLRGLENVATPTDPICLSDEPLGAWSYFTRKSILL